MKAVITSYRNWDTDGSHPVKEKTMIEFIQFVLRAGQRGYTAIEDENTHDIFLITETIGLHDFMIHFEED